MRFDIERVGGRVARDDGLGGLAEAASEASLVDAGADVMRTEGAHDEGTLDPLDDVVDAVAIDEPTKLVDLAVELDAATRNLLEINARFGGEVCDVIASARAPRAWTSLQERFAMGGIFDCTALVP